MTCQGYMKFHEHLKKQHGPMPGYVLVLIIQHCKISRRHTRLNYNFGQHFWDPQCEHVYIIGVLYSYFIKLFAGFIWGMCHF